MRLTPGIPRAQVLAIRFTLLMALAVAAVSSVFRNDTTAKIAGVIGTALLTILASFKMFRIRAERTN